MKSTYLRNKINEFKDGESSALAKKVMDVAHPNSYVYIAMRELNKERSLKEELRHIIYAFLEEVID